MALVLTGIVQSMRPVGNPANGNVAAGEEWQFLSLNVTDTRYGQTFDVQLADKDEQYKDFFDGKSLVNDLSGHKIKATVRSVMAALREIKDKDTGKVVERIPVLRIRVTNIRDLGKPDDEE